MALVKSRMVELGSSAPSFELEDVVTNQKVSLSKGKKATLVMFICNHCPYVKHLFDGLSQLGKVYHGEDVKIYAISSNDVKNDTKDTRQHIHDPSADQLFCLRCICMPVARRRIPKLLKRPLTNFLFR